MTQEDKELLLKDLCARVPYGVKVIISARNCHDDVTTLHLCDLNSFIQSEPRDMEWYDIVTNIKPYLRPLSSMTPKERHEVQEILGPGIEIDNGFIDILDSSIHTFSFLELKAVFDWLNAHHFDYNNLIERGLGIAVTENNNPYKKLKS